MNFCAIVSGLKFSRLELSTDLQPLADFITITYRKELLLSKINATTCGVLSLLPPCRARCTGCSPSSA